MRTTKLPRLKPLLGFLGGLALLGINAFTINCGFPLGYPGTDVGIGEVREASPQISAIFKLANGNSLVYADPTTSTCVTFTGPGSDVGSSIPCAAKIKVPPDPIGDLGSGNCIMSEESPPAAGAAPSYTIRFAYGSSISISTNVDFTAMVGQNVDDFVITDTNDAQITATLHAGTTYCTDTFKAD